MASPPLSALKSDPDYLIARTAELKAKLMARKKTATPISASKLERSPPLASQNAAYAASIRASTNTPTIARASKPDIATKNMTENKGAMVKAEPQIKGVPPSARGRPSDASKAKKTWNFSDSEDDDDDDGDDDMTGDISAMIRGIGDAVADTANGRLLRFPRNPVRKGNNPPPGKIGSDDQQKLQRTGGKNEEDIMARLAQSLETPSQTAVKTDLGVLADHTDELKGPGNKDATKQNKDTRDTEGTSRKNNETQQTRHQICGNCLKEGHSSDKCPDTLVCSRCNGEHKLIDCEVPTVGRPKGPGFGLPSRPGRENGRLLLPSTPLSWSTGVARNNNTRSGLRDYKIDGKEPEYKGRLPRGTFAAESRPRDQSPTGKRNGSNNHDSRTITRRLADEKLNDSLAESRDLKDWLKFTGWDNPSYRTQYLQRQRRLIEIEKERDELMTVQEREIKAKGALFRGGLVPAGGDKMLDDGTDYASRNAGKELFASPLPDRKRQFAGERQDAYQPRKMARTDAREIRHGSLEGYVRDKRLDSLEEGEVGNRTGVRAQLPKPLDFPGGDPWYDSHGGAHYDHRDAAASARWTRHSGPGRRFDGDPGACERESGPHDGSRFADRGAGGGYRGGYSGLHRSR